MRHVWCLTRRATNDFAVLLRPMNLPYLRAARRALCPLSFLSVPLLAVAIPKAAGAALSDGQGDIPSDAPGAPRDPTPNKGGPPVATDTAAPPGGTLDTAVGPSPGKR